LIFAIHSFCCAKLRGRSLIEFERPADLGADKGMASLASGGMFARGSRWQGYWQVRQITQLLCLYRFRCGLARPVNVKHTI
jgi:hypothetical protein